MTGLHESLTKPILEQERSGWNVRQRSQRASMLPREPLGIKNKCHRGCIVRWPKGLPFVMRLTAMWAKWVLGVAIARGAYSFSFLLLLSSLRDLLQLRGVPMDSEAAVYGVVVAAIGQRYGLVQWANKKPNSCQKWVTFAANMGVKTVYSGRILVILIAENIVHYCCPIVTNLGEMMPMYDSLPLIPTNPKKISYFHPMIFV